MESLARTRTQPMILFVLLLLTAFILPIAVDSVAVCHNSNTYISRKLRERPSPPPPTANRIKRNPPPEPPTDPPSSPIDTPTPPTDPPSPPIDTPSPPIVPPSPPINPPSPPMV
ncbi:hypothetical protein MKW94_029756 [Papaver nudicaule]|uniref:Uncharacterized protein n=1 Tax=Papaver nudicaule TaxID=74823 RepID=A0AA41SIZ7_PAPNU|nr:hypothetical protein [Papaver nudicaule]